MLYTSLKFSIEHENQPLGKEIPNLETIMFIHVQVPAVELWNYILQFNIFTWNLLTKTSVFCLNFFQDLPLFNKVADVSPKNIFGNKPPQMVQ